MDITDILLAFPCEERWAGEARREFWLADTSQSSVHFFTYFDQSNECEVSSSLYKIDHPKLIEVLHEKYQSIKTEQVIISELKQKFEKLAQNRSKARQLNFESCITLEALQVQKNENDQSPDELAHFTDWLVEYVHVTSLWQVRWPSDDVQLSVVDVELGSGSEPNLKTFTKYVVMEKPADKLFKYFVKIEYVVAPSDVTCGVLNLDADVIETRVTFRDAHQEIDPTDIVGFYDFYNSTIVGDDSWNFEDDDEEDFSYQEVEIKL